MGASGWHYFTAYRKNALIALTNLHERAFRKHEYRRSGLEEALFEHVLANRTDAEVRKQARLFSLVKQFNTQIKDVENGAINPEQPLQFRIEDIDAATREYLSSERTFFSARSRQRTIKYKSISELRTSCGEGGTHSILDIVGISTVQMPFMATLLPDDKIEQAYGMLHPTKADISRHPMALQNMTERWQCWYFPVWANERKTLYYFAGSSGD